MVFKSRQAVEGLIEAILTAADFMILLRRSTHFQINARGLTCKNDLFLSRMNGLGW